jgi:nitrate/TMAO reductase-like tetraheme cytochrome c subunit
MKKILLASFSVVLLWSCAKKTTPAKAETTSTPTRSLTETTPATSAPGSRSVANEEVIAAGKIVYDAKCGKCHALHATNEFTADRWVRIMDAMAIKAKLTDNDKANALAYVQAGAKQ